jgi:hypothetical protein
LQPQLWRITGNRKPASGAQFYRGRLLMDARRSMLSSNIYDDCTLARPVTGISKCTQIAGRNRQTGCIKPDLFLCIRHRTSWVARSLSVGTTKAQRGSAQAPPRWALGLSKKAR